MDKKLTKLEKIKQGRQWLLSFFRVGDLGNAIYFRMVSRLLMQLDQELEAKVPVLVGPAKTGAEPQLNLKWKQ